MLRINKSKEPESHSALVSSMLFNKWQIVWWVMQRTEASKSEAQWDSQTSTWEFAAEELHAVRVPRHGTTGKWPSLSDILTLNALLPKWKKSLPLLFQTESKLTLISGNPHDSCRYLIISSFTLSNHTFYPFQSFFLPLHSINYHPLAQSNAFSLCRSWPIG